MSVERQILEIDFAVLQKVFDTAVNSMNFGSGFLDDEEVEALRECALALGVDPMNGTPDNFKPKYRKIEAEARGATLESDDALRERALAILRDRNAAWPSRRLEEYAAIARTLTGVELDGWVVDLHITHRLIIEPTEKT